ncbi:glycerophosphodiester phosphodiesterase [Butyrivibrio sp. WCD2001]|uniref:glycerophosphodiester phosphodiesterase n=1 Tax=Butyrivibrio sp. WCD2001 TaxID=1280681 RepID=UPI0004167F17|nr:glycerophosphodiester phosphodiesterase family protein [Butyrivibrio sp. WCD2001]
MKRTTSLTLIITTLILLLMPITTSAQTTIADGNATNTVKSVSHRGYNTIAPENTLPAYELSYSMGFQYVEADISFTSDGIPVLLHDATINRTARNSDGSEITPAINISNITYAEALQYDFGIWKSQAYKGTKISTFEDFLTLCKNRGLHPYIELKSNGSYQVSQINMLVDMVTEAGLQGNVTWISFNSGFLTWVKAKDPYARLGYIVSQIKDKEQSIINTAIGLRSGSNDVFLDLMFSDMTNTMIELSKTNHMPIEIWTINTVDEIKTLDPYISGITTNAPKYEEAFPANQAPDNNQQNQYNQNQNQDPTQNSNQHQNNSDSHDQTLNQTDSPTGLYSSIKVTQPGNNLKVSWQKEPGVYKYGVFAAYLDKKFGAKPNKTTKGNSVIIGKIGGKKLNAKKNYKIYVVAYDKSGNIAGTSVTSYVAGKKSKKYTNPKSIELPIDSASLISGSSIKLNAKIKMEKGNLKPLPNKKVAKLRYVSSDPKVAAVDNSGKISATGNGDCYVYVYSANGLSERISISVKD